MNKKSRKKLFLKIVVIILLFILAGGGIAAYKIYHIIFHPNVLIGSEKSEYLFIPNNGDFETLKNLLYEHAWIANKESFEWIAKKKRLPQKIHPGRYEITPNMNNNAFIDLLRSGKQTPVKLTFNNIRTKEQFAGRISENFEFDSITLITLLNNPVFLNQYQKKPETVISLFIPNTYLIYWDISAEKFVRRMKKEYDIFWNDKRKAQAAALGMSIDEVTTLASIVQEESNKNDEKPRIAGVYINRLKSGWPLQADPTLKFALGNFAIRRILDVDKKVESPYNTYKYLGLPPGPICMAEISSIDAVLNYEHHNYYYFCAKDDMSGYHVFESSLSQHNINAKRYWSALKRAQIYR